MVFVPFKSTVLAFASRVVELGPCLNQFEITDLNIAVYASVSASALVSESKSSESWHEAPRAKKKA